MEYPQLKRVIEVIKALRDPETGCPWDLEQTHESLLRYLIEESYEFSNAVKKGDPDQMRDEMGDVLLQVLLHSQIASEANTFDLEAVAKTLADKMIYRHPHVFKDPSLAKNSDEVMQNWEKLKRESKNDQAYISMEDTFLPALMASHKIGYKSQKVNFDWDSFEDVMDKAREEWQEFEVEIKAGDKKKMKEELGDLFFSLAQVSRHLGFEAEEVLQEANQKFVTRFGLLESKVKATGKEMNDLTTEQLEEVWGEVKKELKK